MSQLLVIGGVSVDRVHLDGWSVETAGGAGLYTALAARRCGVDVDLLGPRPDPCPDPLQPMSGRLGKWLGPVVTPEQLPRFEIRYGQEGVETQRVSPGAGASPSLTMLPVDLSGYDLVHVCALTDDGSLQASFVQACRQRGAAQISATVNPLGSSQDLQPIRAVMEAADVLFLEERAAVALFDSLKAARTEPGRILYITKGTQGAYTIQGDASTPIAGRPAPLMATGASESFCGATLAHLLQVQHPIMAAQRAMALVREMDGQPGPGALLSEDPPPAAPLDPRVRIDEEQVQRVAKTVAAVAEAKSYPWVGPAFPQVGHPKALDWMFAATLQQFSFWTTREGRYHLPLIEPIGGVERKGSDYLWFAITRQLERDPEFCTPERQAALTREELLATLRADNGADPMPALDLHLQEARRYGRDMLALGLTPQAVVDRAQASARPLETILLILDHVGGYKEDPLRKKSLLLAMGLKDRPERLLSWAEEERLAPIMDYHLMRTCLRTGLIEVVDQGLRAKLVGRQLVSPKEEWAVRYPAYLAYDQLVSESGRSPSDVNGYLFGNARSTCPEMTEPQCQSCLLDPVCVHHKEYFQPVLRTTFY